MRDRIFRRLVQNHGFRALVIQDSAVVAAQLDRYVHAGDGSAESALEGAWRPWRTGDMAAALEWIREFNRDHPDAPVRIFGAKPVQAQLGDYDAVLDHVRESAPERWAEVASHLEVIRSAHHIDEHVQHARGTHPGRPFADHARDALAVIRSLSGPGGGPGSGGGSGSGHDEGILARMRLIVEFHERSVAGRGSYAGDAVVWADVISDHQRRTGLRMVYWDGIGHTSATEATLGLASDRGPQPSVGSLLRKRYGNGYVSVAIGFHHGDLGVAVVPEPAEDLIDATLGTMHLPAHWLDLRDDAVRRRWDGPAKARVISGVYDPSRDSSEYMAVASLADAFDVLIHIREVSAVRWLP
ncbi:erythromycin esterase family protein [Streptomyces hiroshimensis]|uniref:erythromycin esterase family protein n=1 Tax=Streptomyces hiroshimensis TaxID=66424 RepID=UPI001E6356AE|nr:erythromycin esterase family protein [Streptomyces hiroshimensis]